MSNTYIPLYRKYRPQKFADLIGQENITRALTNAIELNKVAHAYLFCGPRGTGKTSSARIFAKSLNCVNGPTVEPCGTCSSCVDITNSTPVDVIEIDAASNRSVEDAQNILEKIQYVPIHGKYKIYIIDEVHMLSKTAFNALLKTLEEPPENVVFILATTESHKVLDTIISRCQKFDFRRITVDDIVKRLEYIVKEENINITKEALQAIAKSSQGGMRDSLALLDQLSILDVKKQIDASDVESLLGKISANVLFDLMETILSGNTQEAIANVHTIYAKGNEPVGILSNFIEYLRNLLIIKTCQDKNTISTLTQLSDDVIAKIKTQADRIDVCAINFVIDKLVTYTREIKNVNDRYLWLEICMIELSNKLTTVGFSDLVQRIEELEKAINGSVAPKRPTQSGVSQLASSVKKPTEAQVVTVPQIAQTIQSPQQVQPSANAISQTEISTEIQAPQEISTTPQADVTSAKEVEQVAKSEPIQQEPKEVQIEAKPQEISQVEQTTTQASGGRVSWETLLSQFTSLPSKMFFTNLCTPIEISENKIAIGFTKEIFVTQSKESSKMTQLKEAIKLLFGHANMPIDIRLISDTQANEFKAENSKKKSDVIVEVKMPQNIQQPLQADNSDEQEFYEQQLQEKREENKPKKIVCSDQVKMILELFNGKYMD